MRVAEIFYSIQGEGRLAGVPSVFIRTSGCNLRCVWCDTPYTSWEPEGEEKTLDEIVAEAKRYPARYAVVTGGEPLIAPEIEELTERLKQEGFHITIETAATIFKSVECDLLSMSPKLENSTPWKRDSGRFAWMHEQRRLDLAVIAEFIKSYDYQLKFVAERESDFGEIEEILEKLGALDRARVLVMAQAQTREELHERAPTIVELCKRHGFTYCPRLHIEIWGNRRGT
ncbi:MAG TPA: 7-carboxy-7-deazaguanine synthase QueE [Verrucomicrobiae bacterium]|jgi:7-carboxy-7-deazaguanine synthase|nr:7-carboxy-7-deazaguanine synthase QueE [Verrucomicrobiae bacterium]